MQRPMRPEIVSVRNVVDGNTIDVAGYGRVRLAHIRAPKLDRNGLDGEPFAREARERLEGIVTHRFVRIEFPSTASRTSAYVLLEDGTCVNALMVREGLAQLVGRPAGPRGDELQRAQQQAQSARRGLWGRAYSARSATRGSTRVARRAGNTHAQIVTTNRIAVIATNVTGSLGVIWTSSERITFDRKKAPVRPIVSPSAIWIKPRRRISQDT